MRKNNKIYLMLIAWVVPFLLQAHPHLFIDYTAELVFDKTGLVGVQTEWTFDEMFSWQVIDENTNGDEIIDSQEKENIYKNAFSYLAESGYFAFFLEENKRFHVKEVENFEPRIENGQVIYSFFIPWKVEVSKEHKNLKFLFDDESYFCAVVPKKGGVKLSKVDSINAEISMLDRVSYQITFWDN